MKLLTFIFAFYLLLLTGVPCTDKEECGNISKTETINSSTGHSDHQHENETCNSFCSCACCGQIFVPNFQLSKLCSSKILGKQKQHFFYNNTSLSSGLSGSIWQPPKFS